MNKLFKTVLVTALPFIILPYFMASCKKDPCDGIICRNGGTCVNGICSCPTGFEGPACEKEKVPKAVLIKRIILNDYPATTSSGAPWDPLDGPDLYVTIGLNTNAKEFFKSTPLLLDFNRSKLPIGVPQTDVIRITNVTAQHQFNIWDYDTLDPDDLIGGQVFYPYTKGAGFPNSIVLKGIVYPSFEMIVEYEF